MKHQDVCPGYSNTGAENTLSQKTDEKTAHPVKDRRIKILLDWLGFTFTNDEFSVEVVKDFFAYYAGIEKNLWEEGRKNYQGYAESLKYENIIIYYNGSDEQGIHVDITGQGCRFIETRFMDIGVYQKNWYVLIDALIGYGAKFTRMDIAIDDHYGFFDVEMIFEKLMRGECTSKFKSWRPDGNWGMDGNVKNGLTIYFGSPQSRIRVIMYEKSKQLGIEQQWTRTEIRFRDERASEFAGLFHTIGENEQIGVLAASVLKEYITFRDRPKGNDTNKTRWPVSVFWESFLHGITKRKLASELPDRSISKKRFWIDEQVSKTIAMLALAYEDIPGYEKWVRDIVREGIQKIKEKDLLLIEEFRSMHKKEKTDSYENESI